MHPTPPNEYAFLLSLRWPTRSHPTPPERRLGFVEAIGHRRSGRATAIRSGSTELPVGAAQAVPAADGLAVVADFVILRAALAVEEDGLSVSLAPSQAPQAFWTSSRPITAKGEPSGLMRSDS